MPDYYDYDGNELTLEEWSLLFESRRENAVRWRVADTQITDDIHVSTVLLGLDHSFGYGPPLIFESMVFGGPLDDEMQRYSTAEEAERGHWYLVNKVKLALQVDGVL